MYESSMSKKPNFLVKILYIFASIVLFGTYPICLLDFKKEQLFLKNVLGTPLEINCIRKKMRTRKV